MQTLSIIGVQWEKLNNYLIRLIYFESANGKNKNNEWDKVQWAIGHGYSCFSSSTESLRPSQAQ